MERGHGNGMGKLKAGGRIGEAKLGEVWGWMVSRLEIGIARHSKIHLVYYKSLPLIA